METHKKLRSVLYFVSFLIGVVAVILFFMYSIQSEGYFGELGEITGTLLGISLGLEMALFLGVYSMKKKLIPQSIKKYVVLVMKYLRFYHRAIGAFAVGILLLHYTFTFSLTNLFSFHRITGYITSLLVVTVIVVGLLLKMNTKSMYKLHYTIAFIAIIPFLLHILD